MYQVQCTKYQVRSTHRGGQAKYDIQANDECPTPIEEYRKGTKYKVPSTK